MHPKFIAVLAHGLNLKPDKLNEIRRILEEDGGFVLPVALMGHRGNQEEMRHVSLSAWMREIAGTCEYAMGLSKKHGSPIIFVGFSMGALLLEIFLGRNPGYKIKRKIYLAPALAFHWWSIFNFIFKFLPGHYMFKGLTPPPYNASKGASVSAYRGLFRAAEIFKISGISEDKIPALVFIDPRDELVSVKGLYRMINRLQLGHWKMELVHSKRIREGKVFHHLIIDSNCLEKHEWIKMKSMMKEFLKDERQKIDAESKTF